MPPCTASICSPIAARRLERDLGAHRGAGLGAGEPLQRLLELGAVAVDLVPILTPQPRHLLENLRQARPAIALLGREVGAAPEGLALWV